jgi:uncharacterized pyridoxamine 5'-phosphate oxidase family protein
MRTIIVLLVCLAIGSCAEKPTETPSSIDDEANLPAGRRDYEWRVMEITPFNYDYFFSITGTSPQNIYAGGGQGLWHFNGQSWRKVSDTFLHGISATPSGKVWGVELSKVFLYEPQRAGQPMIESRDFTGTYPDYPNVILNNVWNDADNNVFVYGFAYKSEDQRLCVAFIARFDGQRWSLVPNSKINFHAVFDFNRAQYDSKYLHFTAGENDSTSFVPPRRYKILRYNLLQDTIEDFYSGSVLRGAWNVGSHTYFIDIDKVYICKNNQFELWKDFSNTGKVMGFLFGRHSKDMFSFGYRDVGCDLLHYNGEDLVMIYEGNTNPQDYSRMYQMLVYEKEIFILSERNPANAAYKSIIIHGKLR